MQFESSTKKIDYQVEQGLTKLVNLSPNKKLLALQAPSIVDQVPL
jgi:hypothetical protein